MQAGLKNQKPAIPLCSRPWLEIGVLMVFHGTFVDLTIIQPLDYHTILP
jgi:hypothetical protein